MALGVGKRGGGVTLWDINEEGLKKVAAEAKAAGATFVETYRVDVTDVARINEVAKQMKPVDIVINNAGIVSGAETVKLTDAQIDRTFKINSYAPLWITRAFLPSMLQKKSGHFCNIASAAGLVGVSKLADYCASKWAVVGYNEALRSEMNKNKTGVKCTCICPYYIDTGMFDGVKTRFSLLLPILKEEYVSEKILKAIEKDRGMVVVPPFVRTLWLARFFMPTPLFDMLLTFFGINVSMDEFKGRGH